MTLRHQPPSTRIEEVTPKAHGFMIWLLTYRDQEALLDCVQRVVMDAYADGWDAREKVESEP